MGLVAHAKAELTDAGFFKQDSDYGGMLPGAVLELMETFSAQGHSGFSAAIVIEMFSKLARYELLGPLVDPMKSGFYHDVSEYSGVPAGTMLQSTRLSSVFSEDGGKSWYHLDKRRTVWERLRRSRRAYIQFPYQPK